MTMSNTMVCGATKLWYYVPEAMSSTFEAWLEATRPGYIESLEAGTSCYMLHMLSTMACTALKRCIFVQQQDVDQLC